MTTRSLVFVLALAGLAAAPGPSGRIPSEAFAIRVAPGSPELPGLVRDAVLNLSGSNFQIGTVTTKRNTNPAIAYNSVSNEWMAVWQFWFSSTDRDIYARRISPTGALLGSEFVITQTTADETNPRVAYSPASQRYMVVWNQNARDVVACVINNTGTITVSPFFVDLFVSGVSEEPDVIWRSNLDDFFVAWSENAGSGRQKLYGFLMTPSGTILRDNIQLRNVSSVNLRRPALAYNAARDEYFMSYDNEFDVFGFRIDGGVVFQLSDVVGFSNSPGIAINSAIAYNTVNKEYLVTWDDARSGINAVWGQKAADLGALTGTSHALRSLSLTAENARVRYKSDTNSYSLAWEEQNANGNWDIKAGGVGADLSLGPVDRVSQPTPDPSTELTNEFNAALALNTASGEYLIVWQDGRSGTFQVWGNRATYPAPNAPAAPSNLGRSASTTASITWSWTRNSTNETGFVVETSDDVVVLQTGAGVTSGTETGLSENTRYTRHVHAFNASGSSAGSPSNSAYTSVHDATTADFSLTVVSSSQINVSVTAPPNSLSGLTGVEIQRSTDNAAWTTIKSFSNVYSASDTGLIGNKLYYYRIRFQNGDGVTAAYSPSRSATTNASTTPPAAPTGLAAVGAVNQINLSWNANTEADLASYKVLRSATSGGPYGVIATGVTSTTYSDTGLTAGQTFFYVVQAVNTSNLASANSNQASATVQSATPPPGPPTITTPNGKKTNDNTPIITGTSVAGATITVYFNSVSNGTTIASSSGFWTYHNTAPSAVLADGTYSVTATASNSGGTSGLSAAITLIVKTTPPAPPTALTATPRDSAIELSWTASTSTDTLGYNIYRKAPGESVFTKINTQVVVGTQYRDAGLTNGQTYSYEVTAVDNAANEKH